MNRVILLGRLTRDAEIKYTQASEPLAICRFVVAVDRPFSRNRQEGEPTADFINCVAFGKRGESISKFFNKGNKIALDGRLQINSYNDKDGNKRYSANVIVDDFYFCEKKSADKDENTSISDGISGFTECDEDEDLPF